jgi:predicted Zn-ribbon and HTH transcriptional regulator
VAKEVGFEGIVAKRRTSLYEVVPARCHSCGIESGSLRVGQDTTRNF